MWVGNNWAGTATIVDASKLEVLKRGREPGPRQGAGDRRHPDGPGRSWPSTSLIQQGVGEGHDQYVDDMFTTTDGRYLAVSRPSFADVVWVDVAKAIEGRSDSIVREQQMDGFRTDHMGLSPDGRRLIVSDSTERQVIEYSMVDETVDGERPQDGGPAALLRVRRDAPREQLHRGRLADLPREHRQGLHARGLARVRDR